MNRQDPPRANQKVTAPFAHYAALYAHIDPNEAASRCRVRYDPTARQFHLRLLGTHYALDWPTIGIHSEDTSAFALNNPAAQLLMLRYLLEGRGSVGTGAFLSYRELPWGEVYQRQFTGRCLKRAAFAFGSKTAGFRTACAAIGALPLNLGDAAYQFELLPDYDVRLIVWEGDDEFPPSAQMLFSDNFPQAFTAEDCAVIGDLLISYIARQ